MSALRFIKKVEVTSAVSTVNVTDVFSSDFELYKIIWDDWVATGTAGWVDIRLINSSGSVVSSSNYCGAHMDMNSAGVGDFKDANDNKFDRGLVYNQGSTGGCQEMWVMNPYESDRYTFITATTRNYAGSGDSGDYKLLCFKQLSTITGIQAVQLSGYPMTGSVKVYGMSKV